MNEMLSSRDGVVGRIGAVRTLCLLVISFGLIILFATSYVDRYEDKVCADRVQQELGRRELAERTRQRPRGSIGDTDGGTEGMEEEEEVEERKPAKGRAGVASEGARRNETAASATSGSSVWDYNWDFSEKDAAETERREIADRTLILVRHGQYDLKTEQLTDLGREQALMTGQRLRDANISYTEIVHSTMDRAAETARIIHRCLGASIPIRPDELLVEGGPIPPQPTITYWGLPQKTYHRDGPRMEAAFRKYFHRGDKGHRRESFQILVGHGNIFRFFALRTLQLSRDAWMRVFIAHASITTVHIRSDGTVALTKFGDAGHFPVNKVTY